TCNEAAGVVTCTMPSLAVGTAPDITVTVTAPATAGTLSNSVTVSSAIADPVSGNDSDTETTDVASADLSIVKIDAADPVAPNSSVVYTLTVTNAGPSTATAVSVVDTLPAGVTFVSATGTGWTCNEAAGVVTCTMPSLAAGTAPAITVTVTAPATAGTLSNSVTVDSATSDPDNTDDSDTETTEVATADLSITKIDAADPVLPSSNIVYTLTVTNSGPSTATSVSVVDTLPAGVTFVSATGTGWTCNEAAGVVTCTMPSLGVTTAAPITITVTAPATPGQLSNSATVSTATTDPNSANDTDTETTDVTAAPSADLSIVKIDAADPVAPNSSVVYTLTVTNNGPSTATSVSVVDTLPAGVTFVSATGTGWTCNEAAGVVTCTMPSLAIGTAPDITVTVTAPATAGLLTNNATVSSATNDSNSANDSDSETTEVVSADVSIVKTDAVDPVAPSGTILYTLTVTNAGPSTATAVTVTDTLPPSVTFVSATGTGWTCAEAAAVVTCTMPTLGVTTAPAITITVTAPAAPTTLTNNATVSMAENDSNSANDSDSETTDVVAAPSADLSITKTDLADPVAPGGSITYTLAVANAGPSTATNVSVSDALPAGVTFVSASGTGWTCAEAAGAVTCTMPSLAVGTAPAITVVVTAPAAEGQLTNNATVTGSTADPNGSNDSDSETTDLVADPSADLSIVKSDSADPVAISASLTYTLAVSNAGPSAATAVSVVDTLPAGVTFISASGTGWTCAEAAGVVTCTMPSLAVGAAPPISIVVTTPSTGGPLNNSATVTSTTPDDDPTDDTDTETTVVQSLPILVVTKIDTIAIDDNGNNELNPGEGVEYTIEVRNDGASPATNVVLSDTAPAYTTIIAGSVTTTRGLITSSTGSVGVNIGTLLPNESAEVRFRVRIDAVLPAGVNSIMNQATVTSTELGTISSDDPTPPGDDDPTITTIVTLAAANVPALDPGMLLMLAVVLALAGAVVVRGRM
ncbi:MAG TPA: hypothetical protein VF618_04775, partial [Thermoanaerobaculia bacterium]